jgi:anaerobic ribonucleoside-triphosphate reductase
MPVSEKDITMPSFVQNLYWMMCNGLQEYEDVFAATVLHKDVRKDSSRVDDDGNNYVWACGGTGTKNNAFKMEVLTEILDKTSGYVPNARTLGFVFEDETEEDEVEV